MNCVADHYNRIPGVMKEVTNHDAGVAAGYSGAVGAGGY
jgi:hypothetical protein